jgi:hypothetical protein
MGNEQLLGIIKEAKQMAEEESRRPLVYCPICGDVLDKNKAGILNCRWGHWRGTGTNN